MGAGNAVAVAARAEASAPRTVEGRTLSVWQWQLVFAVAVVVIGIAIALLKPTLFASWQLTAGLTMVVALSAISVAVPWGSLSSASIAALPALDIVAVFLLATSGEPLLVVLWVFPVAWLSTYYSLLWLFGALTLIGVFLFLGTLPMGASSDLTLRALIVMLSLIFIGTTLNIGARRTRAFSRLLRRQYGQVTRAARRAELEEQRAATFLDSLNTAVARVDRHGSVVAANAAYRRLYCISSLTLGQPAGSVEYTEHRGTALPHDRTTIALAGRGETVEGRRIWLFDIEGNWHALDVSCRPVTDGRGFAALVVVDDVTDALEAADHRENFVRIITHELRNPLTAVLGHAEMLADRGDLTGPAAQNVAAIEAAAERMGHLITTILREGATPPASDAIDLGDIAAASVEAFRPAAVAGRVTLEEDITPGLSIDGDAFRLRQVIDNLIGNAVKYTPQGGHIIVDGKRIDGDRIEFTVADTGVGMTKDDLSRVYEPYFRSQAAVESGIPGTGLGMGISREIIEGAGGTLTLTSTSGKGTRAVIVLPQHRSPGGTP